MSTQTAPENKRSLLVPATLLGIAATAPLLYTHIRKVQAAAWSEGSKPAPGDAETAKSYVGETVAAAIQSFHPVNAFKTHLNAIACYADDPNKQLIVDKYMAHVNEDVMQTLIFDSDKSDAKLIGLEYTITQKLFNSLPEDEKKLWKSSAHAVLTGNVVAPRMPMVMEHKLMEDLTPTWCKSVATWQVDKFDLPIGHPTYLAAPVSLKPDLVYERDRRLGVDTDEERRNRADIKPPPGFSPEDDLSRRPRFAVSP